MRSRSSTLLGILILGAGLLLWFWRGTRQPVIDTPAVLSQVRQLNQLATVRYTVQKVVGLREDKVPVGSESILLIMQANVQAGINLAELQTRDITQGPNGSIHVRLPPAQILTVSVDENETKVWDRQKTWWTPWVPYNNDMEKNARLSALDSIRKAALDMGILKQAERNASTAIESLLHLAGVKSVTIIPASTS